ncbi:unnamed protein product, partial [Prorocentrum cordatum]
DLQRRDEQLRLARADLTKEAARIKHLSSNLDEAKEYNAKVKAEFEVVGADVGASDRAGKAASARGGSPFVGGRAGFPSEFPGVDPPEYTIHLIMLQFGSVLG